MAVMPSPPMHPLMRRSRVNHCRAAGIERVKSIHTNGFVGQGIRFTASSPPLVRGRHSHVPLNPTTPQPCRRRVSAFVPHWIPDRSPFPVSRRCINNTSFTCVYFQQRRADFSPTFLLRQGDKPPPDKIRLD